MSKATFCLPTPEAQVSPDNFTIRIGSFRPWRPKLMSKRQNSVSPLNVSVYQHNTENDIDPPTIVTTNITDTDIDRVTEDAKRAQQDFQIRKENSEVFHISNSYPEGGENI